MELPVKPSVEKRKPTEGWTMKSDVKSFVQSFARGMGQQRSATATIQKPEQRTDEVRQLGVEAVAKALDKQGFPKGNLSRFG